MDNLSTDAFSIYSFSNFKLNPPFTLQLIDFILGVDEALSSQLPNRLHHLVKIIKQSFEVEIEPHQVYDVLTIFKQKSKHGKDLMHHNKNIEQELNKYSKSIDATTKYPKSAPFCLSISLLPKSNTCPQCDADLSSTAKFRIVTLYLANGTTTSATVINYSCQSKECSLEVFPNFITNLNDSLPYSFTTENLFSNEEFIYLGGQTAFESLIFKQYSSLLSNGHVAFDSFTRAYNEFGEGPRVCLDRRLFERIFIIYSLIEYQLFMGTGERFRNLSTAFLPRNIYTDIDEFIYKYYDYFYKIFVEFWSSHSSFYPCGLKSGTDNVSDLCSAAIICDGHMKIRRRLCANADVPLRLANHFGPIFSDLIVGCSHTPKVNSKFCFSCSSDDSKKAEKKQQLTKSKKTNAKRKWNESIQKETNDMETLGCNVSKEDTLNDGSVRACGILIMATNCQVIVGFEEILKSESKKQVTQSLVNTYTLAPDLPRIIVYDAGCLLMKFIRNHFEAETNSIDSSVNNFNIGLNILKKVRFFVDRFHLTNHKERYCHENLNLDLDDSLKHINSSSCEQLNSWIKTYVHILSNMNEYRFLALLLVLFHLRNCSHTRLSKRLVDVRNKYGK